MSRPRHYNSSWQSNWLQWKYICVQKFKWGYIISWLVLILIYWYWGQYETRKNKRTTCRGEMEKETKHYVESLYHYPNWLKTITIETDKFPIDHEYIDFFMQIYMQLIKDDGSDSSSQILIIPSLPSFDKIAWSQFKLYIEAQTMTHCFVWCNFQNNNFIQAAEGKEKVFCILKMLRIHTGLWTWNKRDVYDLHQKNESIWYLCTMH